MSRIHPPVLSRPRQQGTQIASLDEISSNFFPVNCPNLRFFTSYVEWGDIESSLRTKYSIVGKETRNCFILSENGDTVFSLEKISNFKQGPAQVILPINRLVRLLFIRESILTGRVSFPLKSDCSRFVIGQHIVRLRRTSTGWAFALSVASRRSLFDEFASNPEKLKSKLTRKGGVRVSCFHGKAERQYNIVGLSTNSAETQSVSIKGASMTVSAYFKKIVNVELRHLSAPLGTDSKGRFLPLELCFYRPRCGGFNLTNSVDSLVALLNEILSPLEVVRESVSVGSRVLPPFEALSEPIRDIRVCAVLFGKATSLAIPHVEVVHTIEVADVPTWSESLHAGLASLQVPVDLFLVVSPTRLNRKVYVELKSLFDLKLGVPSQVVVSPMQHVDSVLSQLLLKVPCLEPSTRPTTSVLGIWDPNAIVISTNQGFTRFSAQVRIDKKDCMEELFYELCLDFFKINNCFPGRLIVFQRSRNSFTFVANELKAVHAVFNRLAREVRTGINPRLAAAKSPVLMPGLTIINCDKEGFVFPSKETGLVEDLRVLNGDFLSFFLAKNNSATFFEILHDTNRFVPAELVTFIHHLGGCAPRALRMAKKLAERAEIYAEKSEACDQQFFDVDTLGGAMLTQMTYL